MLGPWTLLIAQIVAHFALVAMIVFGTAQQWLIVLLIYFLNGCVGMTATYHRLLSHKSWNCPKVVEYFGVFWATIGLTGSALAWVAIHRKHHRHTDTEKDPHSPSYKGFIYCQWLSMFEKVDLKYISDLVRDPFYVFQHKYYFVINLVYGGVLYLIDPFAVVYAWLVPACILWNAGSSIVTFSHLFGTNDHSLKSKARNNWLLAVLVWGEGWHNNHHHDAKQKYFFNKFWQIDVGGYYIAVVEGAFGFLNKMKLRKISPQSSTISQR